MALMDKTKTARMDTITRGGNSSNKQKPKQNSRDKYTYYQK